VIDILGKCNEYSLEKRNALKCVYGHFVMNIGDITGSSEKKWTTVGCKKVLLRFGNAI
jgi:hypothetical protein